MNKEDEHLSFQNLIQSQIKEELTKKVCHRIEHQIEMDHKAIDVLSLAGDVFLIMTGNGSSELFLNILRYGTAA